MLKDKRPRLLAMTLRAIFVEAGHRQSGRQPGGRGTRALKNIPPMRIVALNAIHVALYHWMMLRHSKFGLCLQMALKTRRRIFPWVHNELPAPAAGFDMLAPGPMTRLASCLTAELRVIDMHAGMRTRRKYSRDVRMALCASTITYVSRSRNFRRRNYRPSQRRTGYCEEHNQEKCAESGPHRAKSM
jgi:hypothetical protein